MIKNICLLISITLLFYSCAKNDNELSENDMVIIEKIIEELSGKEKVYASTTYLVSPYLDSFEFHPYFLKNGSSDYMDKKQEKILNILKTNKEGFEAIKQEVNNKYSKEMYPELLNISNSDSSSLVYTFSGLNENIIFVELRGLCGKISIEDLKNKDFLTNHKRSELGSVAVIIDGNEITELIPINSSTKECF